MGVVPLPRVCTLRRLRCLRRLRRAARLRRLRCLRRLLSGRIRTLGAGVPTPSVRIGPLSLAGHPAGKLAGHPAGKPAGHPAAKRMRGADGLE